MKKFNLVLTLAFAVLFSTFANAQDARNPWGISVGAHAVDHMPARGLNAPYAVNNWSIVPPMSKLSVIRHLYGRFSGDITASVGQVDNNRFMLNDRLMINAGIGLRFRLLGTNDQSFWFDPYLRVGAGYHHFDYGGFNVSPDNPAQAVRGGGMEVAGSEYDLVYQEFNAKKDFLSGSLGVGVNIWFTQHFGLNLASDYNMHAFEDTDYMNFMQHTAGLIFKFGLRDRDGDGIPDDEDECPDTPGLPEFAGCPDTDGDGIPDHLDACPDVYGLPEFQGCPDTDGDGVPDHLDRCPNEPGPAENQGCPWPDTDGDGLTDNIDRCPTVPGPKENQGCPWPDRDGDGVPDHLDRCPDDAGPASNDGCPEAAVMVENINVGFVVEFDYNKATIRPSSQERINTKADEIKKALEFYPNMTLYIDGHTDNVGSARYNKDLSQRRAASLVKALEARGIKSGALTPRGLGLEVPKCTNETEEGRQCNRRVEVTIKSTGDRAE
ncbi:MAG: thrombospondin type 3 repeat-containing protein [Weeksellaceae bacterium]|nr:thrombospondin type 3 repeat-containing protein [Weeksellaceae bacterium]